MSTELCHFGRNFGGCRAKTYTSLVSQELTVILFGIRIVGSFFQALGGESVSQVKLLRCYIPRRPS